MRLPGQGVLESIMAWPRRIFQSPTRLRMYVVQHAVCLAVKAAVLGHIYSEENVLMARSPPFGP